MTRELSQQWKTGKKKAISNISEKRIFTTIRMVVRPAIEKKDLLYSDLSYQIVGCAYDVHNQLGPGHKEEYYQKTMVISLKELGVSFTEQDYFPLKFNEQVIGRHFCDIVVENKIIVELKKSNNFSITHINQVLGYLKTSNLKLALLINFGSSGVKCKRIINESRIANSHICVNS